LFATPIPERLVPAAIVDVDAVAMLPSFAVLFIKLLPLSIQYT
jgi:hypothetical protein